MDSHATTINSYTVQLKKPSQTTKLGISFRAENEDLYITRIDQTGIAGTTNLREGDKVVSINGMATSNLTPNEASKLIRKAKKKVSIVAEYGEDTWVQDEKTPLVSSSTDLIASSLSTRVGAIIMSVQLLFALLIIIFFRYDSVGHNTTTAKYAIFRDIMVMLLLGFGFLMASLKRYSVGAVGFTMLLTVINMECNIIIEGVLSNNFTLSMDSLIAAEFSAFALLISFGAIIGRVTPLQLCQFAIAESLFYTVNKVSTLTAILKAEDEGGTITVHMFGAYFGLAAAKALGPRKIDAASNSSPNDYNFSRFSDTFGFIGTTILWVFWPSFVKATAENEEEEMRCYINTIFALMGSTSTSFYLSQALNKGKLKISHIRSCTLAGGVAIGASAKMGINPGIAFIVGMLAGIASVIGSIYSSPYLESTFGIYDTCGVGNLHGYPSILGGMASVLFVLIDWNAEFLNYGIGAQSIIQLIAMVYTLAVSISTGLASGSVILNNAVVFEDGKELNDEVWWIV